MTIEPLNPRELTRWNRWLKAGHGIDRIAGQTIYRYQTNYTLYLTPLRTLPGLCVRQDRSFEHHLISFEIAPGVRTIASLWGEQETEPIQAIAGQNGEALRSLAARGRVWWGTEALADSPFWTSICVVVPDNLIETTNSILTSLVLLF